MKVILSKKQMVAEDICLFDLTLANQSALPAFSAGAHIDVAPVPGLVRQYSLCNNPEDRHRYQIAVLRTPDSRGGSVAMHGLNEGDTLEISVPRNQFPLAAHAGRSILIAGGIGVTPLLCMAERLVHEPGAFEFHYCARDMTRMAFLERFSRPDFVDHVQLYPDAGPKARRFDVKAVLGVPDLHHAHVYVCGPAGFIDFVLDAARGLGYAEDQVHREYFAAAGAVSAVSADGDVPFRIRIASSGNEYEIASQQSVVEVLAKQGIEIPVSCEQGVCGTCITRVLDGTPLHRDVYFTDAEHARNDQFTPCCSRSLSSVLVLDL
ncbi:vanillate O-demethylase ferredoxin subunit [Paraburkholderia sp. GV068]|jgi:vanillate O-demethylase ferredoxin subunit|uniref:PDR/VanB family oxidoreductase n=1 Tax=unclassified Paraburkholderia TaxID=2615204 RepID=UPI000D30478D|nr:MULTISPECIES: PDR/VanB family oxidoreductase [unclassified Paraburkholderia]PTQ92087.1 vanillate O-demethylase ferredoxin subunit [Paraburkholderia sp. GV072]PUA94297.1 vanillate O-demethylase ferredoxin subunit [Paraburkholderia sp. GV068]